MTRDSTSMNHDFTCDSMSVTHQQVRHLLLPGIIFHRTDTRAITASVQNYARADAGMKFPNVSVSAVMSW